MNFPKSYSQYLIHMTCSFLPFILLSLASHIDLPVFPKLILLLLLLLLLCSCRVLITLPGMLCLACLPIKHSFILQGSFWRSFPLWSFPGLPHSFLFLFSPVYDLRALCNHTQQVIDTRSWNENMGSYFQSGCFALRFYAFLPRSCSISGTSLFSCSSQWSLGCVPKASILTDQVEHHHSKYQRPLQDFPFRRCVYCWICLKLISYVTPNFVHW